MRSPGEVLEGVAKEMRFLLWEMYGGHFAFSMTLALSERLFLPQSQLLSSVLQSSQINHLRLNLRLGLCVGGKPAGDSHVDTTGLNVSEEIDGTDEVIILEQRLVATHFQWAHGITDLPKDETQKIREPPLFFMAPNTRAYCACLSA